MSKIHGLHKVLVRLDRRPERQSVTSNKAKQFKATRELLRAFAYEYPQLISKKDYQFAMRTQYVLEINSKSGLKYVFTWLAYFVRNPFEKRYVKSIMKRIRIKIKMMYN
ncbi:MAG TPA: hypothetical protein DHV22_16005 [Xanthomarina gelatinilytica]|uniref:Uncharacterized protein n=1 Tax=Xanthomarina gelatinilytica TaxID=1137281 RepID=A0A3D6BY53_9FLAO|nr:hypothetical protein [Xanthomarina gelatinilytica]